MNGPFKHLGVKLAALLLAILLWFHVATEKTIQYEINLPLKEIDLSDNLVPTEPPEESLDVLVSATGKRLLQSDWKEAGLKLSVSRSIPGRFRVNLDINNVSLIRSDDVELLEVISPRELNLNSDRLMETEVPVKSNVIITPDEGFVLSRVNNIIPRTVRVSGPRRYIVEIDSVGTASVSYKGIRNDLKLKIPLEYPEGTYGLTIVPDTINFIVGVSPITSREFEKIEVVKENFPEEDNLAVEPQAVDIRIGGEAVLVDSLTANQIRVTADYNARDSLGNISLDIDVPRGLTLLKPIPRQVTIKPSP